MSTEAYGAKPPQRLNNATNWPINPFAMNNSLPQLQACHIRKQLCTENKILNTFKGKKFKQTYLGVYCSVGWKKLLCQIHAQTASNDYWLLLWRALVAASCKRTGTMRDCRPDASICRKPAVTASDSQLLMPRTYCFLKYYTAGCVSTR